MSSIIAVVIPFFQREPGILERSLRSVFEQALPAGASLKIVIVDDSSPLPLDRELASISIPEGIDLVVLHRPNGGPGAARNAALDALNPREIEFVAFLDSDDEWRPTHLMDAMTGLGDDADYYFCDHSRFDLDQTWFAERAVMQQWTSQEGPAGPAGDRPAGFFEIGRSAALDGMVAEYISQTSTVVFRFARHPLLRFDTSLRNAGEDHLFWLVLAGECSAVVFSTRANVHCGRGVNIYYSALDWASPTVVSRYGYLVLFRSIVRQRVDLSPDARAVNESQIERQFRAYSFLFFRLLAKGGRPDIHLLRRIFAAAPGRVMLMPFYFLSALRTRKTEANAW